MIFRVIKIQSPELCRLSDTKLKILHNLLVVEELQQVKWLIYQTQNVTVHNWYIKILKDKYLAVEKEVGLIIKYRYRIS